MENEIKDSDDSMQTVQETWMGKTNSIDSLDEFIVVRECTCSFD